MLNRSTRYKDANELDALLDELHKSSPITSIINGTARGVDLLASQWAHSKSIALKRFKVDSAPTKDAFYALNDKMLNEELPDLVLAVDPGPVSDDLTRKATARQIRTITYHLKD